MPGHNDWGIDCETWCGGTPDDEPVNAERDKLLARIAELETEVAAERAACQSMIAYGRMFAKEVAWSMGQAVILGNDSRREALRTGELAKVAYAMYDARWGTPVEEDR